MSESDNCVYCLRETVARLKGQVERLLDESVRQQARIAGLVVTVEQKNGAIDTLTKAVNYQANRAMHAEIAAANADARLLDVLDGYATRLKNYGANRVTLAFENWSLRQTLAERNGEIVKLRQENERLTAGVTVASQSYDRVLGLYLRLRKKILTLRGAIDAADL